jgi:DNA-binding CsgD family transcriptional regulator
MQTNDAVAKDTGLLTPREQEVADLAQRGYTNNEIADRLGITRNAVSYHMKEVHSKLGTGGERGALARRWNRGFGPLTLGIPRLGVPATIAGFAGGLALAGLAAYQAFPGDDARARVMDGRYPNGCPAEVSGGTLTLADFAHGRTTLAELQVLNPDLPLGPLPPETIVKVPYDPDSTCAEVQVTPAAASPTPSAWYLSISGRSAGGAVVSQAETRTTNPTDPHGACADVSFRGGAPNTRWYGMTFDGADVTSRLTWIVPQDMSGGRMCYAPPEGFDPGAHSVEVVVRDPAWSGGLLKGVWDFTVLP